MTPDGSVDPKSPGRGPAQRTCHDRGQTISATTPEQLAGGVVAMGLGAVVVVVGAIVVVVVVVVGVLVVVVVAAIDVDVVVLGGLAGNAIGSATRAIGTAAITPLPMSVVSVHIPNVRARAR